MESKLADALSTHMAMTVNHMHEEWDGGILCLVLRLSTR